MAPALKEAEAEPWRATDLCLTCSGHCKNCARASPDVHVGRLGMGRNHTQLWAAATFAVDFTQQTLFSQAASIFQAHTVITELF